MENGKWRMANGKQELALLLLAASCSSAPATRSTTPQQPTPPVTWDLVWSDEFDGAAGASFDTTKWRPDTGDGCPAICGWGNQEKEFYTTSSENIALDGSGHLQITARIAPAGLACYYGPCRYTSSKITTRGKMNAGPGKIEARIKLPVGQGLWPAFWGLGSNFPATPWPDCGELDIMEFRGSRPNAVSSAIHGPGYSGNTPFVGTRVLGQATFAADFNTFAVVWDSAQVLFYVNDAMHYSISRTDILTRGAYVFNQPFFVILNLAVGGHFDGDPQSDAILPATMLIDYVRVYTRGSD
jgi:beta-glucanase (GH16 family)